MMTDANPSVMSTFNQINKNQLSAMNSMPSLTNNEIGGMTSMLDDNGLQQSTSHLVMSLEATPPVRLI